MTTIGFRLGVALAALTIGLAACGGGHEKPPSYTVGTSHAGVPGERTPGEAGVAGGAPSQRTTFLLSSAHGGFPNGPSRNAAVSHDQRIARYMAYESDASNIVAGDTNGQTDVFLVARAQPFGANGTPWKPAGTQLISKGGGAAPANGPSYRPVIDGDSHHAPHCVAFVSEASNLVEGDTNGKSDGFVYDTRSRHIARVTVDSAGNQSNGSTYDISISGDCTRVAFTSDATNLALTKASNAAWSKATTTAVRPGTRQVYVHVLSGSGLDTAFKGLTFLASAANNGVAGNRDSQGADIARSGKAVVFASTATNLARGDKTPASDVYRRTIVRKFERMDGKGIQTLQGVVGLASATRSDKAGNGPSSHPTVTDDGRYVAFETDASNLLPGDNNGVSDIVRADMRTGEPRQQWVSNTAVGGIGNGASHDPVISDAGEFILFDSEASNLRPSNAVHPDSNGVEDVFLWNAPTRNVSLESRDANNGYLSSPSQHPATSSRGNYVPFESANPLIDVPLATQLFPQLAQEPKVVDLSLLPQLSNPDVPAPQLAKVTGSKPAADPSSMDDLAKAAASAGQQVYVRYLGAK
ncbi:MAG: hypothetical protein ACJ77Z_11090 [Thermoleophilaceae bacterium]